MTWFRHPWSHGKRRSPTLTDPLGMAAIEVDVDPEREGWVVLSLYGHFRASSTVDLLAHALLDVLSDGYRLAVIDASRVRRLSPAAHGALVSGADLFHSRGGLLVVSGVEARDAEAIRLLDLRHEIDLLSAGPH